MSNQSYLCYQCAHPLAPSIGGAIQFRETCASCGVDAHVCRNCELFDPGAHHECRETSAEWVRDKEKANRCDYFRLSSRQSSGRDLKADSLAALDALFKK
jgi:hypothetical protein